MSTNGVDNSAAVGIIIPGPELRAKIENAAASLSKKDSKKTEELMAKVLASPRGTEFLFFDRAHVFYPFFLSKLNEFRRYPELVAGEMERKERSGKASSGGSSASTVGDANSQSSPTTETGSGVAAGKGDSTSLSSAATSSVSEPSTSASTTLQGGASVASTQSSRGVDGVVRREGGSTTGDAMSGDTVWRKEAVQQAEKEARQYLEDPFPNLFSLNLQHGTVYISAVVMDLMTTAAQYVAKFGEPFLVALAQRARKSPHMRFLNPEDPRHVTFNGLVTAYKVILSSTPEGAEDRLERYSELEYIIHTVCAEKTKYAKATIARRKAAMLTDDDLRSKLEWSVFTTIHEFTLADLGLEGPRPERVKKPLLPEPGVVGSRGAGSLSLLPPPTVAGALLSPPFLSASIVRSADYSGVAGSAPRFGRGAGGSHGTPPGAAAGGHAGRWAGFRGDSRGPGAVQGPGPGRGVVGMKRDRRGEGAGRY